jgi:hypothetical protein
MTRKTVDANGLRKLVRLYRVAFWVRPDKVDIDGRIVEVTFQLELRGTHDDCRANSDIPCRGCIRVLTALFEIADTLLPIERETVKRMFRNYEKCMHYSRGCSAQGGVALIFEIKTRRPFEQANDGWAMMLLQEIGQRLLEHGCHQVEPPAEAESESAAIRKLDRYRSRELREADFAATPVA